MSYFYRPDEILNQIYSTGSSGLGALTANFNREDSILNAVFDTQNAALRITTVGSTGDTTYFPGNIHADGNVVAEQYIVSSSVIYVTSSYMSGSTTFGDSIDDIHQFTGSVYITSSLYLNGIPVGSRLSDEISSTQTASLSYEFYFCTTGASDLTLVLPKVADGLYTDKEYIVKKVDDGSGRVIISGDGNNIDGETTDDIFYQYDLKGYKWSGNEWFIF